MSDLQQLADRINSLSPPEKLRLAAMFLDAKRADLAHQIASDVMTELGASPSRQSTQLNERIEMANKNETTTDAEAPAPKSFTFWLAKLSNGEAESHLSYELQKLMERMDEEAHTRNKEVKGSLTLKLNFGVDETGAVGVVFDVATKEPPRKTTPAIYWLNKKSQLVENNPRQQEIPGLRDVGGGRREFGNVTAPTAGAPREV